MIYNAILQGRLSDPDMLVFNCVPPTIFTADAIYGPCRMAQYAKTREVVGATSTLFPNKEFMSSAVVSGLIAFQVKAYGSLGSASSGTEPLTANIGIMQATMNGPGNPLGALELATSTNRLTGSVPVTVWANVPLVGGLGSATTTSTSTTYTNQVVNQDDPNNPLTCSYRRSVVLVGALSFHADIAGQAGTDIDLYIYRDNPPAGLGPEDTLLGSSTSGTPIESVDLGPQPDSTVIVCVHGWSVPGGTTTFTLVVSVSAVAVGGAYSLVNAPSVDIAANTPVQVGIAWTFPSNQAQGDVPGQLVISPGYAPFALAIGFKIRVRHATTPVTVQDFAPVPGSTVADPRASIVANVYDTAVQQIAIDTARLWVDGVEVTQSMRKIPTFASAGSCCYNLLTVAYG